MYLQNFLFELFLLPTILFFVLNLVITIGVYYFNHIKLNLDFWKISTLIGFATIALSFVLSVTLNIIQGEHLIPTITDLMVSYFDYSWFTIILTFVFTMINSGLCNLIVKIINEPNSQTLEEANV